MEEMKSRIQRKQQKEVESRTQNKRLQSTQMQGRLAKQLEVNESNIVKKKEDLIVMSSVSIIILVSMFAGIYFLLSKLPF